MDKFFKQNHYDWEKFVEYTTDGTLFTLGRKSGVQAFVKAISPNAIFVHCFILRFGLCAKIMPPDLLSCSKQIIKNANFKKTSALNKRLFARVCEDLGYHYKYLLYHAERSWLSRGNVTRQVFKLRKELLVFITKKTAILKTISREKSFL